jgi:2-methylcitrate dehydratase PrpD
MKASEVLAEHVTRTRFEDLPPDAVLHAKTFILDTIGVGISGSTADGALPMLQAAKRWGSGDDAAVWGRRERLPAGNAALVNGFQVHCQEFDCVHERAVLHPMATLLPAALAYAEREGGVTGREFLVAVATGVDVATTLGSASNQVLRFFRPATCGGFGATAAVGRLVGLDAAVLARTFGLQYAQTSGTMQPHVEGNVALPMQVGFNARAALQSVDLAVQGLLGPLDTFEGPHGFMRLFEGVWNLEPELARLGIEWQISAVSHKPFPAGRAAHGGIEALMQMSREPWFSLDGVEEVAITAPPLIMRLCARADVPAPTGNYARLCMAFIGAKVLQHGRIGLADYRGDALTDPRTHELARLFRLEPDSNSDESALVPYDLVVKMKCGDEHRWRCESLLASPSRRLTREQHIGKFRDCCLFSADPMAAGMVERFIEVVDCLETVDDMRDVAGIFGF